MKNMAYRIEWKDEEDNDRLEGKTYKNKDEVIDELIHMVSCIIGDDVKVIKPKRKMTYAQALKILHKHKEA
jgi:hypothetical protein